MSTASVILPTPPSFDLTGKRSLVVGASSGIGQGCAVALASAGSHVTCIARNSVKLEDTVRAMNEKGWQADKLVMDVADLDTLSEQLDNIPAFDIVVNSAGLARHSAALDTTPQDYDEVMNLNLRAAYFLSVAAAKGMKSANISGIRTPLTEPTFADPDRVAWVLDKIKLGRVGEVEDIMGAVLYLASPASSLVTGTSMLIDGGWTAD